MFCWRPISRRQRQEYYYSPTISLAHRLRWQRLRAVHEEIYGGKKNLMKQSSPKEKKNTTETRFSKPTNYTSMDFNQKSISFSQFYKTKYWYLKNWRHFLSKFLFSCLEGTGHPSRWSVVCRSDRPMWSKRSKSPRCARTCGPGQSDRAASQSMHARPCMHALDGTKFQELARRVIYQIIGVLAFSLRHFFNSFSMKKKILISSCMV